MDKFCLFVGDVHAGGGDAVSLKPQDQRQSWLLDCWAAMVARGKALARGKSFSLMLGGDLVDRAGKQARDEAIALLQPLVNVSDEVFGVTGTEYHTNEDGEEDRTVYDAFGATVVNKRQRRVQTLRVGGRILWWAHHAIGLGGKPWTEFDGLNAGAKTAHEMALHQGGEIPELVVGHHVHRSPGIGRYYDTQAVICPCWQLQTAYGGKRMPFSRPAIGAVAWWPTDMRLEIMRYAIPEEHWSI